MSLEGMRDYWEATFVFPLGLPVCPSLGNLAYRLPRIGQELQPYRFKREATKLNFLGFQLGMLLASKRAPEDLVKSKLAELHDEVSRLQRF